MGYSKLFSLIDDRQDIKSIIMNLSSFGSEQPYLVSETLNMLSNESIIRNIIPDKDQIALACMLRLYFNDCWAMYSDVNKYIGLAKYSRLDSYSIESDKGLRPATESEIRQGVMGLQCKEVYPAGEEFDKTLNLLLWTMTGNTFYFRRAGFKNNFDTNGKITDNLYQMIYQCSNELNNMFKFIADKNKYNKCIKIIEKYKKSNGIKYASYASDEIKENMSIKQLMNNIKINLPRHSSDENIRKAIALYIKSQKKQLTPMEISYLRGVYSYYINNRERINIKTSNENKKNSDSELKKKCEILINERYRGKIDSNHFAYRIIDTLSKYDYSRCSVNQYRVIEDALRIIHNTNENKEIIMNEERARQEVNIISDDDLDSYESISDFIGEGLFDDSSDNFESKEKEEQTYEQEINIDDIIES